MTTLEAIIKSKRITQISKVRLDPDHEFPYQVRIKLEGGGGIVLTVARLAMFLRAYNADGSYAEIPLPYAANPLTGIGGERK